MDCFALPYKAMVIKLLECNAIQKAEAEYLLSEEKNVEAFILSREGLGSRWLKKTNDNNLNAIKEMIKKNLQEQYISEEKAKADLKLLNEFMSSMTKKKNQE